MLFGMSSPTHNTPALQQPHNGWTPVRRAHFLQHLADTGSVAAAARAVGMSRQSAYALRRQPGAEDFARAWDDALADAGGRFEELVMDRIVEGEAEVIEREGCVVEVRRRPCDVRLLLYHLKRLEDRRIARQQAAVSVTGPDASIVSSVREEIIALAAAQRAAGQAPPATSAGG
jgi:hypothetical protein